MPSNYDPDTLIQTHGNAAFQQVLNQARPLDQFIWDVEMARKKLIHRNAGRASKKTSIVFLQLAIRILAKTTGVAIR